MNDKTFRTARLIRLSIILGILFLFAWMFRWELGTAVVDQSDDDSVRGYIGIGAYTKLDRWTGNSYHCVFLMRETSNYRPFCLRASSSDL